VPKGLKWRGFRSMFSEIVSNGLRIINWVSAGAGKISGTLSFLLMFLISGDVCFRYFFNVPIAGTNEISRLTLAWVCFFGIFYAYTSNAHVRVTLLTNRFPTKQPIFEIISCLFGLLIFGFLSYKSSSYFWESWVNRELYPAPVPVPHWLAKLSMPVGSYLMVLALILNLMSQISKIMGRSR
jgi:TRAP-type C4-dicarboxylate transport system permease small subunit